MIQIVLTIHIMLAASLVVVVLLQRSEGGGLGIGGGGGGGGGMMTSRGAANLLTRSTGMLGAAFFATSLGLAILASGSNAPSSIIDSTAPIEAPEPSAPLAR